MTYTVVWVRSAEADLARYWTESQDRQAIADAADALDRMLRADGEFIGAQIAGQRRRLTIQPLTIDFEVSEQDLKITVVDVRLQDDTLLRAPE